MDFQRFSAKTVGDAVTAACQHFLVTSDKLEYEIWKRALPASLDSMQNRQSFRQG